MHIRPARREDKAAIMKILGETVEFSPADLAVAEEVLDIYIENPQGPDYRTLVAENSSGITGYVIYGPAPLTEGSWDVYWMAVPPALKGRGIGTALLGTVEAKIKEARGRLLFIETSGSPAYDNTRRFYDMRGYTVVSRIADYYSIGDDKVIFQKKFSG